MNSRRLLLLLALASACANEPTAISPARATLTLTSAVPTMDVATSVRVAAAVTDARGEPIPLAALTWKSADSQVAQVFKVGNTSALIEARQPGATTITVQYGSVTLSFPVLVRPPGPVETIQMASDSRLVAGATLQLWATLRDSAGVVLPNTAVFSSSDTTVVYVTSTGVISAAGEGVADVTARANGKEAHTHVVVLPGGHAFTWNEGSGTMRDLGVIPGFAASYANAVSARGSVAGYLVNARGGFTRAFRWDPEEGMRALDLPGGAASSVATGINDSGMVVGYTYGPRGSRSTWWDASGSAHDMELGEFSQSEANGVNDAGQVVGWVVQTGQKTPFVWTRAGGARLILEISGAATAINSAGEVVGEGSGLPFRWTEATGLLVLPLEQGSNGGATAISSTGNAAGWAAPCAFDYYYYDYDCTVGPRHAVLWGGAAASELAHSQPLAGEYIVTGVNATNRVVGTVGSRAFHWVPGTGFRLLDLLPGQEFSKAAAVNDAGVVVGSAYNR